MNLAHELTRLLEARDLAAYRAVSVIQVILDFFEAQDYESARRQLVRARADFLDADARVTRFYNSHEKEIKPRHGYTNASCPAVRRTPSLEKTA